MALTDEFIKQHVAKWEATLTSPFRPYRSKWPSRLFHHAPIENAVKILLDGNLRSRDDPANQRAKDVAAPGVIDARDHAHSSARLYFRPRTPTQYHIEGIRKRGECQYGDDSHAPVLVMMVFNARNILALPGVQFCDRNMQLGNAQPGDSEEYFSAIPFEKVFHEGNTGGDRTIIEHRCAEVLAKSPLLCETTFNWSIAEPLQSATHCFTYSATDKGNGRVEFTYRTTCSYSSAATLSLRPHISLLTE